MVDVELPREQTEHLTKEVQTVRTTHYVNITLSKEQRITLWKEQQITLVEGRASSSQVGGVNQWVSQR